MIKNQNQRQNKTEKSSSPIGCKKPFYDDHLFNNSDRYFFSKNFNRVFNSKSIIDPTTKTGQKLQAYEAASSYARTKNKIGLSLISLEIEALTNLAGNKSVWCFRAKENVTIFFKVKSQIKF